MFAAKFAPALIAAIGIAAAVPASAETFESNGRTFEVRHGDLNLTQAKDRKELRRRIASAATKVCQSSDSQAEAACRMKAIRHVKEPINVAIARAETKARYAEAAVTAPKPAVGN